MLYSTAQYKLIITVAHQWSNNNVFQILMSTNIIVEGSGQIGRPDRLLQVANVITSGRKCGFINDPMQSFDLLSGIFILTFFTL